MRLLSAFVLAIVLCFSGCDSNKDRQEGVCYCEFFQGDDQEYDLTDLSRAEQVSECQRHDGNAANFGGTCKLE